MKVKPKEHVVFNLPDGKQDQGIVKSVKGEYVVIIRKDGRKITIGTDKIVNVIVDS